MVTFLFDHAQTLHVRGRDRCALFAVSQSAGSAKAREIIRLLCIVQLDPRWCLPSKLADNPLVWMIEVNGFVVDVWMMPRELQEEAHRLGLIPFVRVDRRVGDERRVGGRLVHECVVLAPSWPATLPRRDHRGTSERFSGDLVALPAVRRERGDSRCLLWPRSHRPGYALNGL